MTKFKIIFSFRFIQGIAASAVVVCSVSILMSIYPEKIYQIISVTDAIFGLGYTLGNICLLSIKYGYFSEKIKIIF